MPFQHVLAVFASANQPLRRELESRLVNDFSGGEASYRVLDSADVDDPAAVRRLLDDNRFDSAIIMHVVLAERRSVSFTAALPRPRHLPLPASTFVDQWTRVWRPTVEPALVPDKQLVAVEVEIYSLADGRLVWSGLGEPGDIKTIATLGVAAADAIARELSREGLLADLDRDAHSELYGADRTPAEIVSSGY